MKKEGKKVHLVADDVKDERKVIVVLEKAPLEVAVFKKHENVLLNGDDHANYIMNKLRKDPADYRPDITHQCLLTLLDSPLNKAGLLQVYVTTASNQVIKIHSSTRIPRTYKRFAALFAQLLKRLSIRAEESS
jgi:rRNA small subunit pseudouridine methyltransferase Nep1